MIRVLVGCEYSGRVSGAFRRRYPEWRVASCPSDHRKADRSLTYQGIAEQWGEHLELFA